MISAGENKISPGVSCHYGLPFTVESAGTRRISTRGSLYGEVVSEDNADEIGATLISGRGDDGHLDVAVVPVPIRTVPPWAWPGEEQEITAPSSRVYHLRLRMDSLKADQQIIASRLRRNFFAAESPTLTTCWGLGGHDRSRCRIVAMDNGE